ncbi:MAG: cytochrome c oxidase subunit 3 [Rickettsiales bacterium]|nr:cytochrome c oxidase subunit 3 [Rickettsiales bacterium]
MGTQHHDYHLVDPSPRPLITAFAAFFMALGGAFFMSDAYKMYGKVLLPLGTIAVLWSVYMWWKDVIKEGMVDKAHTSIVQKGLRLGMILFIVSEIMFFFAFFWAFFKAFLAPVGVLGDDGIWAGAAGIWPPEGIVTFDPWDLPLINTLVLLLSGTTVTWAHHALLNNDRKSLITGLSLTVALGVAFSLLQALEYSHAAFGFTDGIYASNFYMATGFHGLHVILGTIFLAVCLVRAMRDQFTPENHLGFEFAAWYWHFVDVVWIFLFVWVYWIGA